MRVVMADFDEPRLREVAADIAATGAEVHSARVDVSDKASVKACLLRYVLLGWSGYVPAACRNTLLPLPANIAPWVWGYPHRLTARMKAAGTDVILLGDWSGGPSSGIDDMTDMDRVPRGFDGYVWTNRIEEIGPALRARK